MAKNFLLDVPAKVGSMKVKSIWEVSSGTYFVEILCADKTTLKIFRISSSNVLSKYSNNSWIELP